MSAILQENPNKTRSTRNLALAPRSMLKAEYLKENSLCLPLDFTYEEWVEGFKALVAMDSASKWWLGDSYFYGEEHFGEMASQVLSTLTEYEDETIRAAIWVSKRFPPDKRVSRLSWSHHREVAAMEEKERQVLLNQAADQRLSVREVRKLVPARMDTGWMRGRGSSKETWNETESSFAKFTDNQLILYALKLYTRIARSVHLEAIEAVIDCEDVLHEIEELKDKLGAKLKSAA